MASQLQNNNNPRKIRLKIRPRGISQESTNSNSSGSGSDTIAPSSGRAQTCNPSGGIPRRTTPKSSMVTRSMTEAIKLEAQQKNMIPESQPEQQKEEKKKKTRIILRRSNREEPPPPKPRDELSEKISTTLDLIAALIHQRAEKAKKELEEDSEDNSEEDSEDFDHLFESIDKNMADITGMIMGRME